ncbi:MAG: hypothetical protein QS748_14645 [Candidatus Endonucleobacter bathymodioli]|uniref:Uncharacterized protein n=1 Tax=Candidatus Endonucleibacter bathymodioli TaxID=539814 RepID=A0AA90SEC4_9GAMM|nr:hypothetical protein [Candidatus Endonucleobacter bathymodioli]
MKKIRLYSLMLAIFISGTSIAALNVLDANDHDSELNVRKQIFYKLSGIIINHLDSRLSIRDLSRLSMSCHGLYDLISDNGSIVKLWFSRLSTEQQTQFKKRAEAISEGEIRAWIAQFAGDKKLADKMIALKNTGFRYYPHKLFHTISGLMTKCSKFKLDITAHILCPIDHVRFSADRRHVMMIRVDHDDFDLQYTKINGENTLIRGIGTDGKYYENKIFVETGNILELALSDNGRYHAINDNGHYMVVLSTDTANCLPVLGLGLAVTWTDKTLSIVDKIIRDDKLQVRQQFVSFSPDSTHMLIQSHLGRITVWSLGMGGEWSQTCLLSNSPGNHAFFSDDGFHIMTSTPLHNVANIWSMNDDGKWVDKATINIDPLSSAIGISSDSRHIVVSSSGGVKVFSQSAIGKWTGTKVVSPTWNNADTWAYSSNFSDDGCHLVLSCTDHCIRVCSWGENKQWTEKANYDTDIDQITNMKCKCSSSFCNASFSADSRSIIVIRHNSIASIFKLSSAADTHTDP